MAAGVKDEEKAVEMLGDVFAGRCEVLATLLHALLKLCHLGKQVHQGVKEEKEQKRKEGRKEERIKR